MFLGGKVKNSDKQRKLRQHEKCIGKKCTRFATNNQNYVSEKTVQFMVNN